VQVEIGVGGEEEDAITTIKKYSQVKVFLIGSKKRGAIDIRSLTCPMVARDWLQNHRFRKECNPCVVVI
jgi:hypothetical protein